MTRHRGGGRWRLAALAITAIAAWPAVPGGAPGPPAVLERLHAYLEAYEPKLSELVADEDFRQELQSTDFYRPTDMPRDQLVRQHLIADFGFLRLPGDDAWLGHRSVRMVDGVAVLDEARRLERLLGSAADRDLTRLARAIADENARHNLGHARSMNVPTLALELLGRRHADAFTLVSQRSARMGGRRTTRLFLRERHPGRLVAFDDTRANRADVVVWIDEAGAVVRSDVTLFPPRMLGQHTLRVDFAPNAQFGLLVPVRLEERFNGKARGSGVATYTNYRRFQTSGRLLPPGP